jgi:hypothetical protein
MPIIRRLAAVVLLAVLAALFPAPAGGQDFEITDAAVAELGKAVLPFVEKETGASLEGVALRLAGAEDLRRILEEELLPQMRVLDLEPEAAKARAAAAAAILSRAMVAKYAFGAKAILVCPGNVDSLSREIGEPLLRSRAGLCAVLAHEAAHAADDLKYGFSARLLSLKDPQALQVFNAVIEGHAQVVARKACEAGGWGEAFEAFRRSIGKEPPGDGSDEGRRFLSRVLTASLASAYWDGETFMRAVLEKGGEKAVERAFAEPPADPEVLHHPEWFLDPASRPPLAFDFDGGLALFEEGFDSAAWAAQKQPMTPPQIRAALSLLPAEVVDRIARACRTSRFCLLTPRTPPAGRMVVALLIEFAGAGEAVFYMAAAERLSRIKDEKMKSGSVKIVEAAYETVREEGWQGFFAAKTVESAGSQVRVFDLVACSGSLSLELLYSGVETDSKALAELGGRILAAAKNPPAPAGRTPPAEAGDAPDSPRRAFETLLRAVRERDIALYKSCFTEEALKGEAEIARFERDPEGFWTELQGVFRGPQTLNLPDPLPAEGPVKGRVEAPEAEHGGIGTVSFLREGGRWKIHRW